MIDSIQIIEYIQTNMDTQDIRKSYFKEKNKKQKSRIQKIDNDRLRFHKDNLNHLPSQKRRLNMNISCSEKLRSTCY